MSPAPRRRWGLGARLLAAIVAVILVAAGTAWAVASAIGPEIFHDHMLMAQPSDSSVITHAEEAFTTAWTLSLSLALLAALLTSVVVSVFLTRRIARSLERVRQAAAQVASGDYAARVPEIHMGTEFDDLAGAFNTMAADLGEIEQTRTRMLGDLAHEMRTPVATLDGYLEGILDGVVAADEPTLGMLREQAARLARLAQDITLVTAAGEGRLSMHWQPLKVGALIEDAAAQAAAMFTDEGVEPEGRGHRGGPPDGAHGRPRPARAGADQPAGQRRATPPRRPGAGSAHSAPGPRCACRCATAAAGSLPSTCRTSSSASTAPTRPGTAPMAGQGSGSPSSTPSSSPTAAL